MTQDFFNFEPEPEPVKVQSYRDALIEQIVRDEKVLREDPIFHVPDREFYEQRIAAYKETPNGQP